MGRRRVWAWDLRLVGAAEEALERLRKARKASERLRKTRQGYTRLGKACAGFGMLRKTWEASGRFRNAQEDLGSLGEALRETWGDSGKLAQRLMEAWGGMSGEVGKALEVRSFAIHTRFANISQRFMNMASFFVAIYMNWRTWHQSLLIFTMVGDHTSHFWCYVLFISLVSMGFIFAASYYGLRAASLQTS
jgi:hypothetical protein